MMQRFTKANPKANNQLVQPHSRIGLNIKNAKQLLKNIIRSAQESLRHKQSASNLVKGAYASLFIDWSLVKIDLTITAPSLQSIVAHVEGRDATVIFLSCSLRERAERKWETDEEKRRESAYHVEGKDFGFLEMLEVIEGAVVVMLVVRVFVGGGGEGGGWLRQLR